MHDASEHASPMTSPTRLKSFGVSLFGHRRRKAIWRYVGVVVASLALLVGAAIPAAAAELMRVTFVRHGESAGNASGLIDTSTPGPVLTPLGHQQAQDVVGILGDNNYDGIYSSTMVRTQLTAAPMSQYLRLPIQVLPGLQEIEAGVFEGTPESEAQDGYGQFLLAWAFANQRDLRIPGSINGHEFDARMDGALQNIYDNGDRNPVVFSHGGAIMFWTMMNVQNLTMAQKIQLLSTAALGNTDYVVIEGNPEDGWTLVNWNGQQFAPERSFLSEVQLQVRTLTRQLTAATQQVFQAFATGNIATIATAINRAVVDAAFSVAKFGRAVNAKIINEFTGGPAPAQAPEVHEATSTTESASTLASTDTSATLDEADATALTTSNGKATETLKAVQEPVVSAAENATEEDTVTVSDDATDLNEGDTTVPGVRPDRNGSKSDDSVEDDIQDDVEADVEVSDDTTGAEVAGGSASGTASGTESAAEDAGTAGSAGDGDDSGDSGQQRDAA